MLLPQTFRSVSSNAKNMSRYTFVLQQVPETCSDVNILAPVNSNVKLQEWTPQFVQHVNDMCSICYFVLCYSVCVWCGTDYRVTY